MTISSSVSFCDPLLLLTLGSTYALQQQGPLIAMVEQLQLLASGPRSLQCEKEIKS